LPQKGNRHVFGKFSLKGFQRHLPCPPFLATKKLWLPFKRLWRLDGDYMFLNCPPLWVIEFFWLLERRWQTCFGCPILRRLKNFNCHKRGTYHIPPLFGFYRMVVIESNSDWNGSGYHLVMITKSISIAIWLAQKITCLK